MESLFHKLQEIINTIEKEALSNAKLNLTGKEKQYAACLCLRFALEYYERAKWMLEANDVYMASLVSRTAIENIADMVYILENENEEFAKRYVASIETFAGAFRKFQANWPDSPEGLAKLSKRSLRIMNRVNDWIGPSKISIETRIKNLGGDIILEYDMLSYFTHPNPAITHIMTDDRNMHGHAKILAGLNLNLLLIAIADSKIYGPKISITKGDIDKVGKSFNLSLFAKVAS